uniref:Transposase MuDR plant domain-containing protein n=1 Tax=Lactuca sativa TaxID=4236 RepID=A0A9R1XH57_LACSA|nr:hypothetical protein LSAT_V11C400213320 [Lactuca sativa]
MEEEGDKEEVDENDEDDKLDDIMAYELEVDEEVHTLNKTVGDDFLNKISSIGNLNDDDEPNDREDDMDVFPVHDEKQEWDKMVPIIGMKFSNPMQLKLCVTNYAVKSGYDLWCEKSDHNRLLVKCCKGNKNKKKNGCPFRLWETWMTNERMYTFKEIEGTLKEHYAKTWSYGEELRSTNPGSTVKMDVDVMDDGTTYFSKFYVCLKGVKDGWIQGCRRVIGLDGYFIKGICRGQFPAVVGRDANNHIYPLACAVVAVESIETWKWFVDLLLDDIEIRNGHGLKSRS